MFRKTHLVIALAFILIFLPNVSNKWIFVPIALISTLIPDIDAPFSAIGRSKFWTPLQFFVKHRGILHSLTFCILLSILFAFFIPVIAFPFFLGYSIHLIVDSFTHEGITPFWPWRRNVNGFLKSGTTLENAIFILFVVFVVLLLIGIFF